MNRIKIEARASWQASVENIGFSYHTAEKPYWFEEAYYSFSPGEVDQLESATQELWALCLEVVGHVIANNLYGQLRIPAHCIPLIEKSWLEDHPSVYGRFDLAYSDKRIKLLEFNADTPTSLFEAAIVQWYWLQDFDQRKDQFNSIHEKLVECWKSVRLFNGDAQVHFSCVKDSIEDLTNVEYLRDCAMQADLKTSFVFVDDLGWDLLRHVFVDIDGEPIHHIFKLYPWEWLVHEDFDKHFKSDRNQARWIEPPWKMILSNKGILPLLWELFTDHPLLLPSFYDSGQLRKFVKKPFLSREGSNIAIVRDGDVLQSSDGEYGEEGFVYQEYFPLPDFEGCHPVIGSWVIGDQAAGIGIRESDGLITDNYSRFVPHLIS